MKDDYDYGDDDDNAENDGYYARLGERISLGGGGREYLLAWFEALGPRAQRPAARGLTQISWSASCR